MHVFDVVSPAGGETTVPQSIAPRLPDLTGKTIGELWNGMFKGNESFPVLRRMLQDRFPGLRIIPYTEFPFLHGGDNPSVQKERARQLALLAREKGCDAVISGNGA